jgi:hypothetical protein
MVALKLNHRSAYQDIVTQQQARLAQRASSISPDLGVFIPAKGGIPDNSSAALTTGLIQAGLQGVATGVNTYLAYGQQPNPSAPTSGSVPDLGANAGGYGPPTSLMYTGVGSASYGGYPSIQLGGS